MFDWWGSVVHRRRWMVVALALGATLTSVIWGAGVFGRLSQGGYDNPNSQSSEVANLVSGQLGHPLPMLSCSAPHRADEPSTVPASAPRRSSCCTLCPCCRSAGRRYARIGHSLDVSGLTSQVGGAVPTSVAMTEESNSDLESAEVVSLPVTLILLLPIFGGLAIDGSLGVLRLLSLVVDVNSFALGWSWRCCGCSATRPGGHLSGCAVRGGGSTSAGVDQVRQGGQARAS